MAASRFGCFIAARSRRDTTAEAVSRVSGIWSRNATSRVSCSCPSGVGVEVLGSNRIGSISIRSMRESAVDLTRPIKLTGAVIAFSATWRSVLQMSRNPKR